MINNVPPAFRFQLFGCLQTLRMNYFQQDLDKLSDEELKTLQNMAAVFAGQAGDGAPGSKHG